ncbi:hypothetical protein TrVE_jg4291 [Triparma verrucosa]|uniref:Acyl-CoA dehydrogenase n=1 Tax=Triparma verrucosa TaxID=1606542 RepID=A0A9W7BW31_9STRA|nr:hypothetical protein TrVE_jg4291 [Triparma verrucosa]
MTNSLIADVIVVWGRNEEGFVQCFVLEKGQAGLDASKIEGKFSLRASDTGMIFMEDVFVPAGNVLPHVTSLGGLSFCLNNACYGIAWGALAAAEFFMGAARSYTIDRKQFGSPLAANHVTPVVNLSLSLARLATCSVETVSLMSIIIIRHVMNLEAVNIYKGTRDVHALILGRAITGIPSFVPMPQK